MKLVPKRRCDTKNLAAAPNLLLHRIIYYHILASIFLGFRITLQAL
jgi:hypothetical protein